MRSLFHHRLSTLTDLPFFPSSSLSLSPTLLPSVHVSATRLVYTVGFVHPHVLYVFHIAGVRCRIQLCDIKNDQRKEQQQPRLLPISPDIPLD